MADIRNRVQGIDPNAKPRDLEEISKVTGNIYESLAIIAKRTDQLTVDLKHELRQKLEEFAVSSDIIEEISENKEQIEISKFYERLPNPAIIALEEFLNNEIYFRKKETRE